MKTIKVVSLLTLLIQPVMAESVKAEREVLINNKTVEVIRLTYPPGTESGMHTHKHPNRVVYVVKGGEIELVPADKSKSSQFLKLNSGMVMFVSGNTHNVRNIGKSEVVLVETEIKRR